MTNSQILVLGHLIIYVGIVLLLRIYLAYRQTGINPMQDFGQKKKYLHEKVLVANTFFLMLLCFLYCFVPITHKYLGLFPGLQNSTVRLVGVFIAVLGFLVTIVAQVQMSGAWRMGIDEQNDTELITTGLFAYSRNPIYFGLFIAFVGFFCFMPGVAVLVYIIVLGMAVNDKVKHEETHLRKMHPQSFPAYCNRVKRWI